MEAELDVRPVGRNLNTSKRHAVEPNDSLGIWCFVTVLGINDEQGECGLPWNASKVLVPPLQTGELRNLSQKMLTVCFCEENGDVDLLWLCSNIGSKILGRRIVLQCFDDLLYLPEKLNSAMMMKVSLLQTKIASMQSTGRIIDDLSTGDRRASANGAVAKCGKAQGETKLPVWRSAQWSIDHQCGCLH